MRPLSLLAAVAVGFPMLASASQYNPEEPWRGHIPSPAREVYGSEAAARAAAAVDRDHVAKMRKHHQGAVTMSLAYLGDSRATHSLLRSLARTIITNQEFEIAVLNEIGRGVDHPPRLLAGKILAGKITVRQTGQDGLEHEWHFVRSPPPGFLELAFNRTALSAFDVRYAKGMIIHHQAAVDMARAYNGNPVADNTILKAMNRDIVIDQRYEIGLLERLIRRYPGDPEQVSVDPSMVHGMPDHGG